MTKPFLLALLVLASSPAMAATWEFSGGTSSTVDISKTTDTDSKSTFVIDADAGYFLDPHWELALDLGLVTGRGNTTFTILPGVKYNFAKTPQNSFFVRAQPGLMHSSGPDGTNFTWAAGVGKRFAFNDFVAYTPEVYFTEVTYGPNYHQTDIVFQLFSVSVFF